MGLLRGILGFVVAWILLTVFSMVFVVAAVVTWRRGSRALLAPLAHFWSRATLACIGIRVIRDNESTVTTRAPRVLIINHASSLDIVWVAGIMPPATAAIGKRELIYMPVLNVIWWAVDSFFIDRSNRAGAIAALQRAGRRAHDERLSILIAPEGTRSRDGTLQPFKKGAFQLAMRAGLPIFPVVCWGASVVWPRERTFPRPGIIKIRYLPPIQTDAWTPDTLEDKIAEVRAAMADALTDMRA